MANALDVSSKILSGSVIDGLNGVVDAAVATKTMVSNSFSDMTDIISDSVGKATIAGSENVASAAKTVVDGSLNSDEIHMLVSTHSTKLGEETDNGFGTGIDNNADKPVTSINTVSNAVIDEAKSVLDINSPSGEFIYIGDMIIAGLVQAIEAGRSSVVNSIVAMIQAAIAAAQAAAGIHSPSTEGAYIGQMFDLGIVQGTDKYSYLVREGAVRVIEDSIEEATGALSSTDIISKYVSDALGGATATITLDVDTTELDKTIAEYKQAKGIYDKTIREMDENSESKKLREEIKLRYGGFVTDSSGEAMRLALERERKERESLYASSLAEIARQLQVTQHLANMQAVNKEIQQQYNTEMIVNFNQTNNSPKALSRLDIYRDTQRQLNSFYDSMKQQNISKGVKL